MFLLLLLLVLLHSTLRYHYLARIVSCAKPTRLGRLHACSCEHLLAHHMCRCSYLRSRTGASSNAEDLAIYAAVKRCFRVAVTYATTQVPSGGMPKCLASFVCVLHAACVQASCNSACCWRPNNFDVLGQALLSAGYVAVRRARPGACVNRNPIIESFVDLNRIVLESYEN